MLTICLAGVNIGIDNQYDLAPRLQGWLTEAAPVFTVRVSPEELLRDDEAMDFLLTARKADWEKQKTLTVHLTVPKFDVSSDLDLVEGLKAMGVTDVFDPNLSDFSPLIQSTDPIFVNQAKHAARVHIDEEGCEAAAYTVIMMMAGAAAPPDEELDFVLDRPFLFVITSPDELPLFAGLVNRPAE